MELLWKYAFDETAKTTRCTLETVQARPVLATEGCFNTRAKREKTCEVMFEGVGVRDFHLVHEAVLPLYACGRTTGVVVDCGHDTSYPVPVHEGYVMEFAIPDLKYNLAGRHLLEFMTKQLTERKFKVGCGIHHRLGQLRF